LSATSSIKTGALGRQKKKRAAAEWAWLQNQALILGLDYWIAIVWSAQLTFSSHR
jgi:hypothetical protein